MHVTTSEWACSGSRELYSQYCVYGQHFQPLGFFSCWPCGLELTTRFHLAPAISTDCFTVFSKPIFLLDTTPSSALGVFNDCDCASVTRGRKLADGRGNTHMLDYSLGVTFIKFLVQADSNDYAQHGATMGFWSLVCSRSSQYVNSFHFHVSHTNCPLPQDCCRW